MTKAGADPGAGCRKVPPTLEAIHTTYIFRANPRTALKTPNFGLWATPHEKSWIRPCKDSVKADIKKKSSF